jgi:hypothetical protein
VVVVVDGVYGGSNEWDVVVVVVVVVVDGV